MTAHAAKTLPPLHRTVVVPWKPDQAFRRFTTEIASWWPLRTHSVGGENALTVEFEGRVGGRIVERERDGNEHEWGRVLDWDPPTMVRFTWYPGGTPDQATEVELRFTAEGEGSRLNLIHSKWEQLGKKARIARRGYPIGWAYVLAIYAGRRGPLVVTLDVIGKVAMAVGRLRGKRLNVQR